MTVEIDQAIHQLRLSRPHWSNERLVWGFETLICESNFIRLRELFKEDSKAFACYLEGEKHV